MADIVCKDIQKYYGANHILKGISLEIYEGERVGLLGKNGAGKTTLFKVLAKSEPYEEGQVFIPSSRLMEVLDQIPVFPVHFTVRDVLNTGFDRLLDMQLQMQEMEKQMSVDPNPIAVKQYGELQTRFEVMGGYLMETDLFRVCTGLQIDKAMLEKPFQTLSGGEQTRVNLGRIILKKPDILLLDEPTNHLDMKSVEWLEEYLTEYKGTVVVISHDRYFLDRVVSRIIEIEQGKAVFYTGNYSSFIKQKEERVQKQLAQYEQEQRKIQQLEEAAKRMHDWANRADNESMHKRAFAMEKRIEWLQQTEKPYKERNLAAKFHERTFSGKEVLILKDVYKSYGDREVLCGIHLLVQKGDRIGLLGPNGCGKTTLLNLITQAITPDRGEIRVGKSVNFAFLPQIVQFDRQELTMLETVRYAMEWSEETTRNRLAAFQFTGEEVFKPIHALSGGEKSRLKLFLLMQMEMNLLILDEPTNHLDITSREWIETAVESFQGTLLFVSHDRYFIQKFANRIWDMENGQVTDYKGTYKEYRQWKQSTIREAEAQKEQPRKAGNRKEKENVKSNQKRIKAIEQEIAKLEQSIDELDQKMEQSSSDYEKLQELLSEKKVAETCMEELYELWGMLIDKQFENP